MMQHAKHRPRNVPEVRSGDGRTILWLYLMQPNCTPNNVFNDKFYVNFITIFFKGRNSVACF